MDNGLDVIMLAHILKSIDDRIERLEKILSSLKERQDTEHGSDNGAYPHDGGPDGPGK